MGRARALARVSARRGISPIVATVLLILLAVAASVVVWVTFQRASSTKPIVELSASAQATMSPSGVICSVDLNIHNDGNTRITVTKITFTYNGKSKTVNVNRDIPPGSTIGLSFTLSSSDFGAKFADGYAIQITINYIDPHGNNYSKTIFATIATSS